MNREFSLSNLLNQTFKEIGDNARLIGIYLAIAIPVAALSLFFDGVDESGSALEIGLRMSAGMIAQDIVSTIVVLVGFAASLVLTYWLYLGMVRRTEQFHFDRFGQWLGIYVLSVLGAIFGLLLLIIPGIILLVRWQLALPLAIEGKIPAMDSFGQSWERTRGYSWSIFGGLVIVVIAFSILSGMLGGLAAAVGGATSIAGMAVTAVLESVSPIIFAAFAVAAYRLLNDDTEQLSEVFE